MNPNTDLEREFDEACREAIAECRRLDPPYNPTVWERMVRELGGVEAARRLLVTSAIQSGFERLIREGRPDLSIEFAALNPKWGRLFNEEHRRAAWWRLERAAKGDL
jgi:hypothetical protein